MKRDKSIEWHRVEPSTLDLNGTKVAIVGGTGGIGRALARFMAGRGASVIVVGQTFRDADVRGIEFVKADLSLMREAKRVGEQFPAESLDLLVLTTGIFAAPKREETAEGLERDMAVSYLSRLALLREIAPRLGKDRPATAPKPRVFVMGYPGSGQEGSPDDLNAEKSYSGMRVHMNTVAGNEMLVLDAKDRYPRLNTFGLNPGLIKTNIRANFLGEGSLKMRFTESMIGLFTPSAESYAEKLATLLVSRDLESRSGAMFDQKLNAILPTPKFSDRSYVQRFIADSEALVARATTRPSA